MTTGNSLPPGGLHAPAADRNAGPILDVLRRVLRAPGAERPQDAAATVLEVASGTGQHAVAFARALPHLRWQPSDPDPQAVASIAAWAHAAGTPNLADPLLLDATVHPWPVRDVDAVVCINMIHIAPWAACQGLMSEAGRLLPPDGVLVLYGPYRRDDAHTAPSNAEFDVWLKARDPRFGVRDMEVVAAEAAGHGMVLEETVAMPANNFILVFRKADS